MTGEYITELEALQVVAGDILKENKRVRLVGEAEETSEETSRKYSQLNKYAEELFSNFGLPILIMRTTYDQCQFLFRDRITFPLREISDWYFDTYTGKAPLGEEIDLIRGEILIEKEWGKSGSRPILYLRAHEAEDKDSYWAVTRFEGNEVQDGSLVDTEIAELVKKVCAYIRSKATIKKSNYHKTQPSFIRRVLNRFL